MTKRYYQKNCERLKAYQREYRKNHKEYCSQYQRIHKDRIYKNQKLRRENNPDQWKGYMLKRYGITFEQWQAMLAEQDNACAICKRKFESRKKVQVDHCHKSGMTRKLLCSKCNMLVGFLEGPQELLDIAVTYLKMYNCRLVING